MPPGEKIGALHSDTTLGTFNGPCNLSIGVDFILYSVALPDNPSDPRASTNITYPQPQGTSDRFGRWGTRGRTDRGGRGPTYAAPALPSSTRRLHQCHPGLPQLPAGRLRPGLHAGRL